MSTRVRKIEIRKANEALILEAAEKIFEQIKSYLDNRLGTIYWRRPLDVVEENGRNFTASCRITFVPV